MGGPSEHGSDAHVRPHTYMKWRVFDGHEIESKTLVIIRLDAFGEPYVRLKRRCPPLPANFSPGGCIRHEKCLFPGGETKG